MTSTMASSGVRQTTAFTVPSTQNTAPVLEYRCLYTHDLRRKQKRWQDGLLRFHTFNKRIMVYDISRNYIGDMHWREDEILQDGDEFELDRGILIQVGEATGSTQQNLTGLFEKRKKAPDVAIHEEAAHQPEVVSMARPTAAQPSQLQPKTLNALLGTPKGRIGRAALPMKSPHELHMECENRNRDQDRPSKRQRIESPLEKRLQTNKVLPPRQTLNSQNFNEEVNRTIVGAVVDKESKENQVPTTVRKSGLSPAEHTVSIPPLRPDPRSTNGKEEEASKRIAKPRPKESSSGMGSSELTAQQRRGYSDQGAQVSPKAKRIAQRPDYEPETGRAKARTTKPVEAALDEDATSTDQQPSPRLKLQMVSRKPRKKLMYRDLLPHELSAKALSSGNASNLDRGRHNQNISSRPEEKRRDAMAEFHREEQERLKARLHRHHAKEIQQGNEREEFCGDPPQDLFLSQEDLDSLSAHSHGIEEKDAKQRVSEPPVTGSRRRITEPVGSSTRRSLSQEAPRKEIPRPPSSVHSTAMTLAKMDEILFPSAQPKSFESVKDKDALTEVLPLQSSSPSIAKVPPDAVSTPSPPRARPTSSPAFQTQAHAPSRDVPREETSIQSGPNPDSLSAFTKTVQPKTQAPQRNKSDTPQPDPHSYSIPPRTVNPVPALSTPKHHPVSAPGLPTKRDIQYTKPPTLNPLTPDVLPQPSNAKPNSLLASTKIEAPKPPTTPEPPPKPKPTTTTQPAFTKVAPTIPHPEPPDETIAIPSSQPPNSPPPDPPAVPPPPSKRKPDSLPAFTKVIPTKPQSRSPLMKSVSDTSALQPPSALPVAVAGGEKRVLEDNLGRGNESPGPWNKEAWDLFGCARDGVECTYEEFKRKEGLV